MHTVIFLLFFNTRLHWSESERQRDIKDKNFSDNCVMTFKLTLDLETVFEITKTLYPLEF